MEDHYHHIFSQLHIHYKLIGVESNLSPIFLFMIVPNHDFIPLILVNQYNHIRLIHHLYNGYVLLQALNLLFYSQTS